MTHSITLQSISMNTALEIARLSIEHAHTEKMAPIAVAVLDIRGVLKAYLAADGTSLLRYEIAFAKAWSALGMGFGTRELERRASKMPVFFSNLQALTQGKMPAVAGGLLIRNSEGQVLGAVGISGDTSSNDEICAIAAIKQLGLVADHGDPQ
jgi:uncharacterized protein GlcG (DUF336 family)